MSNLNYAIVITAYNRAEPLKCLLESLNAAKTFQNVPLVISIDNQGTEEVNRIANAFQWLHGEKKVVIHPKKLGLRAHFIWAGDQTEAYDNVLFLEDDLFVSPYAGEYVEAVIRSYADDDRIAGGALYNPLLNEFSLCKFYQIEDGFDNYFFQHPYWGNVWMKEKWRVFKKWLETYEYNPDILPKRVQSWNVTSFKKLFVQFLIETNRYIVYPRVSYLTNMGEKGLHSKQTFMQFHVAMQNGHKDLKMSRFDESMSVYDGFFEFSAEVIKRVNPRLRDYDFTVDIMGLHEKYTTQYVLTQRKTKSFELSFCNEMRPIEQALLSNMEGTGLVLAKAADIIKGDKRIYGRLQKAADIAGRNYTVGMMDIVSLIHHIQKKK